ncbi:MAG: GFA family protein [Gammaproteobacteria bacterium]
MRARSCHCSRCRKAFSGASSAYAELVDTELFAWVSGSENLQNYSSQQDWGLVFCKTCGTTICGTHKGRVHGVALGTVNGDPGVEIEAHIFVGSKAPWDHICSSAPQFETWQ